MNIQVRELLLRIPPSPETDELQSLLENIDKTRKQGFASWWKFEGKDIENIHQACVCAWINSTSSRD
jgi:hypothetical protein